MKLFTTSFKAILQITGELVEFSGPNVPAPTWMLAEYWCQENAGHLFVTGELVEEVPEKNGEADFKNKVDYSQIQNN